MVVAAVVVVVVRVVRVDVCTCLVDTSSHHHQKDYLCVAPMDEEMEVILYFDPLQQQIAWLFFWRGVVVVVRLVCP